MNNISISGRFVYEPELKTTKNGTNYVKTRIAANRNDKNKTVDFFGVQAWNKTAEFIVNYFHKGDPIEITGKLQTDTYDKQDGTKVSEVYIFITEVGFTMSKKEGAPAPEPKPQPKEPDYSGAGLPFEI